MKTLIDLLPGNILTLEEISYKLIDNEDEVRQGGSSLVYKAQQIGGRDDGEIFMIKELCPYSLYCETPKIERVINGNRKGFIQFINDANEVKNSESKELFENMKIRAENEAEIVKKLSFDEENENNSRWYLRYGKPVRKNGTLYTVIKTESGETLDVMIREWKKFFGDKDFVFICDCMLKILNALEPMHKCNYLHLDISPDNIYFSEFTENTDDSLFARLIDYNSAFLLGSTPSNWIPSFKRGYSADELMPRPITKAQNFSNLRESTDLYSVAAIFFRLLIGRTIQDEDWSNLDGWQINKEHELFAEATDKLIRMTNDFLRKGIALEPDLRFKKADEMRREIKALRNEAQKRTLFGYMEEDISDIKKAVVIDSAKINHTPQERESRFHFSAKGKHFVALEGRQQELAYLTDFCSVENKLPFSWWVVTGAGGTGKSRLCYEFAKIMERQKWTVCYPVSHDIDTLRKCIESLPNNTLFILDSAENKTSDIFNWMSLFATEQYKNIFVRVILILREGLKYNDIKPHLSDVKSEDFIKLSEFCLCDSSQFLSLKPLDETCIKNILINYSSQVRQLSDTELSSLYQNMKTNNVEKIPLYAIVLVDTYLDNSSELSNWTNKEDFLDELCDKEEGLIHKQIKEYCGNSNNDLFELSLTILAMATMTGGIDVENELEHILPDEYRMLESSVGKYSRFFEIPLLFVDKGDSYYCNALEPDIIGEYFVLRFLDRLKRERKIEKFITAAWSKPFDMGKFVNRLYQDFGDLLLTKLYVKYFKNITIPESMDYIPGKFFKNYHILESIILPESITTICDEAFFNCYNLTNIVLPVRLRFVMNASFAYCLNLKSVKVLSTCVIFMHKSFFRCINLHHITLPRYFAIAENVFAGCANVKFITENKIQSNCDNYNIHNDDKKIVYYCDNNIIYNNDKTIIYSYPSASGDITIPSSVKKIGAYAFSHCINLKNVKFLSSVIIENYAFASCSNLEQVKFTQLAYFDDAHDTSSEAFADFINVPPGQALGRYQIIYYYRMNGSFYNGKFDESGNFLIASPFFKCDKLKRIEIHSPNCEIDSGLFCGLVDVVIVCHPESTAEKYAVQRGIAVEYFDSNI